jgi:hypothetical protein
MGARFLGGTLSDGGGWHEEAEETMIDNEANGDEAISADLLLRLHGKTGNATARLNTRRREHGR